MSGQALGLHLVVGADKQVISIGERQANWLRDHGEIDLEEFQEQPHGTGIYRYSTGYTAQKVNARIFEVRELHECDFCRLPNPPWRVNLRGPVMLALPDGGGGPIKDRPVLACDVCVGLVRANAKAELIERVVTATVETAIKRGGEFGQHVALLDGSKIRAHLAPYLRRFVQDVFAQRKGYPERIEEPTT